VLVREEHALPGAAEFLQRLADKRRTDADVVDLV